MERVVKHRVEERRVEESREVVVRLKQRSVETKSGDGMSLEHISLCIGLDVIT